MRDYTAQVRKGERRLFFKRCTITDMVSMRIAYIGFVGISYCELNAVGRCAFIGICLPLLYKFTSRLEAYMNIEKLQNLLFEMDSFNGLIVRTSVTRRRGMNGMVYDLEVLYTRKVLNIPELHEVVKRKGHMHYRLRGANEIDECTYNQVLINYTEILTAYLTPACGVIEVEELDAFPED